MATVTQTVAMSVEHNEQSVLYTPSIVFTPKISELLILKRKREEIEDADSESEKQHRFIGFNKRQQRPEDVFLPKSLPRGREITWPQTAYSQASRQERLLRAQLGKPACCLSSKLDVLGEESEPESCFLERQTLWTLLDSCLVGDQTEFQASFDEAQTDLQGSWLDWEWVGEDETQASLSDDEPLFPGLLSYEEEIAAQHQRCPKKDGGMEEQDQKNEEEDEGYDSAENDVKPPPGLGKSAPGQTLAAYYSMPIRQQAHFDDGFVEDEDEIANGIKVEKFEDEIEEEEVQEIDEGVDYEGDDEGEDKHADKDNGDSDEEASSDGDSTGDFDFDNDNSSDSEEEGW